MQRRMKKNPVILSMTALFTREYTYMYIVIYTLNQKEQSEQGDLGRRPVHFNGQLCQGKGPPSPLCSRYNHQSKGGKIIL